MSNSKSTVNELSKLLDELDEETLDKMDDAEILELRKKLNPYGRTIEGSNKVLTFSYTDLQGQYQKKILTTARINKINSLDLKSRPSEIKPEFYYKITELFEKN